MALKLPDMTDTWAVVRCLFSVTQLFAVRVS